MLLKRSGITISSVKTWLNWLRKRAMRAVANGKISAFFIQAGKSEKKNIGFNLIRLH